jgi:hypothetical protein
MTDTVDGVEGEWVTTIHAGSDPDWNKGHWRFVGSQESYKDGVSAGDATAARWEKFVPNKPKLADLPNGSIVGLLNSGGGFYVKSRGVWNYYSVMFGELSPGNPDESKRGYVIREGEGKDN